LKRGEEEGPVGLIVSLTENENNENGERRKTEDESDGDESDLDYLSQELQDE
jgi:hypothetical protein